jgi:DNA repair protein RecN (Recombination protein N)
VSEEDELVVRREVTRDGPNQVFLNDEPVTLKLLARIAPALLRIHAQREELNLVSSEFQRQLLDRSAGKDGQRLLSKAAGAYADYQQLMDRWQRLAGDEKARLERLDLLRFQKQEIDAARVIEKEEEDLRSERDVLRHLEAIREALGISVGSLLEELRIRLEEMSRDVTQRLQEITAEPGRLDEIEERLALLERLFRKYGATSTDVLDYRQRLGIELDELTMDDESKQAIQQEMASSLEVYRKRATELSAARSRWGATLAKGVESELADLAMARARFSVALSRRSRAQSPLRIEGVAVEFGADGFDEVVFELAANPGEAKGALAEVASGGELSRVYLALRLAVGAARQAASTSLIFDEIDAGIGGAEAAALGKKLRRLANGAQVFAVTHLPQVASYGHRHYRVRKSSRGGRTRITVDSLGAEARVEEIARMLAGKKVTSLSRSHAEELLAGGAS